ncbi:trace amine-associated receptor 1-like [Epinephelus moara]|uniref:trace amine-associated receptor 1-like n=1 Tax=Epinephelus moara TaxID=300413 RepID=UPI00214F0671|nr:trace amine-associated receptor 1-like [Epinephelus moara]
MGPHQNLEIGTPWRMTTEAGPHWNSETGLSETGSLWNLLTESHCRTAMETEPPLTEEGSDGTPLKHDPENGLAGRNTRRGRVPHTVTPSTICVLIYIFLGSLSVVTVCGNLLVIISIIYFKQLHTPTNSLILSLAVADLLVGVVVFPLSMAFSLSSCLHYEHLFCKVREGFDITLSTASILNLCCISIDRYYAVCQPLTYRTKINGRVVVVMILVSWSASASVTISLMVHDLHQERCKENCFLHVLLINTFGIISSFYGPVIIVLSIYLKIFVVAQRQAHSIRNTTCQSSKSGTTISKNERKATKTLAIVLGAFLMCWTPYMIVFSLKTLNPIFVSVPLPLFETLNWLALSNSMLNPFIYAFFYSWFRSAFRMVISGKIFQGDFANTKLL